MSRTFLNDRVTLFSGDCLAVLPTLPECSVDSVVCDPPYHLASIVKRFAKTGRTDKTRTSSGPHQRTATGFMNRTWDGGDVAFRIETWTEVLRVLKPGGYIVAFSSSRTFGRMSVAIEDAGFITHPFVAWIFGQGFPKAHRVHDPEWEGWRYGGQALKPAIEPIYMGQKPFSEENGTANVLKHGCGALNIDGCRVEAPEGSVVRMQHAETGAKRGYDGGLKGGARIEPQTLGRWPANVVHDGSDEVVEAFPDLGSTAGSYTRSAHAQGEWLHAKPVGSAQAGFGDSGSAARFFYTAKADADDRLGSKHPTVKPLDLMQWLVRLVTPPGGVILDPFAGTGTTGEAAWREGFSAVLIEREPEYIADIERRMVLALAGPDERARESIKARLKDKPIDAGPLFNGAAA